MTRPQLKVHVCSEGALCAAIVVGEVVEVFGVIIGEG